MFNLAAFWGKLGAKKSMLHHVFKQDYTCCKKIEKNCILSTVSCKSSLVNFTSSFSCTRDRLEQSVIIMYNITQN